MAKVTKADPFDVWGHPPKTLTRGMTKVQIATFKRYADQITRECYRLAYDNGLVDGLTKVGHLVNVELDKERQRMLRTKS